MRSATVWTSLIGFVALQCLMVSPASAQPGAGPGPVIRLADADVSIPLQSFGGRPVVAVTIADRGPFPFILDTGAMITVVDETLASELGLPLVGEIAVGSPAGDAPIMAKMARIESLGVGDLVAEGVACVIMDLASVLEGPEAPRGVLSTAIFSGYLAVLDFAQERLVVREGELPPANGSDIFDFAGSLPSVPISVAGVAMKVHLDTGAPYGFSLPGRYMKELPLASDPAVVGHGRTVDAEMIMMGATLSGTVTLGRFTFENPELSFNDRVPIGTIGGDLLSRFTVTVDHANDRLRFEESPAGTAKRPDKPRRYGMRFRGIDGDQLIIDGVDPGAAAARGDVRAGDIITRFNGTPLASLDRNERIEMLRGSPLALTIQRDGKVMEVELSLD